MTHLQRACLIVLAALATVSVPALSAPQDGQAAGRPRFVLRAIPPVGITPARVVFTAELQGGADDYEEFYCVGLEWNWGDGTRSESSNDCEPYEAGRSEIRRRFTVERVFRRSGRQTVFVYLKQRNKTVATASAAITIQPGAPEY
jgi:hypothetical protein